MTAVDTPAATHLRHGQWSGWTLCSKRITFLRVLADTGAHVWHDLVVTVDPTCPKCLRLQP